MITNPIIRGFNPDPSVIRIGEDYYIATSTFEWWPGINIYHSKDLVNWSLHSRPLNKKSLLDLKGVPDGGGIWAPCLSYDGKTVYLVFTVVKERGPMMHTDNYLIKTEDINLGWSERVYLNSVGFDPSLFHDDDGRKYLISLENHYEKGKRFNGLYIEEYDADKDKLTGGRHLLYTEPSGELVEGAHLYKKDGYYYLLKAQGGTGVRHSAQMARSKSLFGKWEEDESILLHARDNEHLPLQKAGHADLVDTPAGDLYMVHLASRGLYSPCGRETCIQKVIWHKNWLRLAEGGCNPFVNVAAKARKKHESKVFYDFRHKDSISDFQSLREDLSGKISFSDNGLTLKCGSGLNSRFEQSLLARRIDEKNVEISINVLFRPDNDRQTAGLVLIYDTCHWHYLYITKKRGKNVCKILSCDRGELIYYDEEYPLEAPDAVLAARLENSKLSFFAQGKCIKEGLDASILSDEYVHLGFTGAMAGFNCIDLEKREKSAVFKWMEYSRLKMC
ncbi:MAG: family 43 glycosylhydrolase [Clostridia bacterium]|nr:family 43 glycosylhydrolase [Clostridia bacterium]